MPLVINTLGVDTHTDAQTHTHTDERTKRFQETSCVQPCVPGVKIMVKIFVLAGYKQKYFNAKDFIIIPLVISDPDDANSNQKHLQSLVL